eukprot:s33_g27.t1
MEYWRRSSFLSVLGGYSPVDVKVNESVVICDYDPAQRKSFRHKFVASAFTLPAGTLRLGQNCLRISTREVGSPYGLLSAKLVNLLEAFLPTTMLAPDDDLVFLNIYNLGKSNAVQSLNGIFKNVGLGAFHCAVQVFGTEWSYGGWPEGSPCDRHDTGVWSCLPRMSVSHTFHEAPVQVKPQVLALLSCEAVVMGSVTISEEELVELICSLMQEWPMSEYDLLNKNCCHFCEELCELLGVGPLPSRVKKLAGLGSTLNESAAMMAEAASKVRADIVGVGVVASSLLVQAAVGTVSALGTADVAASGDSHRPSAEQNKLHLRDYLHRAGRTARFGEPGKVTSLVKKGDKYLAKAIERCVQLGKPINELQKPQSPRKVVRTRKWSRTIQLLCLLEFGPSMPLDTPTGAPISQLASAACHVQSAWPCLLLATCRRSSKTSKRTTQQSVHTADSRDGSSLCVCSVHFFGKACGPRWSQGAPHSAPAPKHPGGRRASAFCEASPLLASKPTPCRSTQPSAEWAASWAPGTAVATSSMTCAGTPSFPLSSPLVG